MNTYVLCRKKWWIPHLVEAYPGQPRGYLVEDVIYMMRLR